MSIITAAGIGGAAGSALTFIASKWISTRLEKSINAEYDKKLANHKAGLDREMTKIRHDNNILQLKMAQRFQPETEAYSNVITTVGSTLEEWAKESWSIDVPGFISPMSRDQYDHFKTKCRPYRLFLDEACDAALRMIEQEFISILQSDDYDEFTTRDLFTAYGNVHFLANHLTQTFRNRLGLHSGVQSEVILGICGGISLVQDMRFRDIDKEDPLIVPEDAKAEIMLIKGREKLTLLRERLKNISNRKPYPSESNIVQYIDDARIFLDMIKKGDS